MSTVALHRARGGMLQQASRLESRVETRQAATDSGRDEPHVGDVFEVFRDRPQIGLTRHPVKAVEASQVDRSAITAQRALAAEIEVLLEIRHREFSQRAIDRFAVSEPRELAGAIAPQSPRRRKT